MEVLCDIVQAPLVEAARWLVALASAILSHKNDADMPVLHMLSTRQEDLSVEQLEERQCRKSNIRKMHDEFAKAKMLVNDRESGKRKIEDMSPADQELVADFDRERLHTRRNKLLLQKRPTFRSHVSSVDAAAEHAAESTSARPDFQVESSIELRERKVKRQRYQRY